MATKLQLITAMYEYHIGHVTGNSAGWRQFLRWASRNYKLGVPGANPRLSPAAGRDRRVEKGCTT